MIWTGRRSVVHDPAAPALSVRDLSVSYDGSPALSDVRFDLLPGEHLAVVGPNGAGKSTLLKAIAGVLSADLGTVRVHGHGPSRHICIGYLPQRSQVDQRFPVTVYDVVMMGRTGRIGAIRRPRNIDHDEVRGALAAVELSDLADRPIETLSGGQQQRMFIARALAQQAEILLMDEPFAGLDVHSRDEILALIRGERLRELTLVVALHDLGIAAAEFDVVLLLRGRAIGFGPPSDVFTPKNLRQAYGSCLRLVQSDGGLMVISDTACTGGDPDGVA